jgi:hypothetical protein
MLDSAGFPIGVEQEQAFILPPHHAAAQEELKQWRADPTGSASLVVHPALTLA